MRLVNFVYECILCISCFTADGRRRTGINGVRNGCVDRWIDRLISIDGWMDGWMDGRTDICTLCVVGYSWWFADGAFSGTSRVLETVASGGGLVGGGGRGR